ncbi:MAG: hypothetical protein R3E64_05130 [Halioglobus sp.]
MPVNELELRVYGLMRSGNHAIIEWLLSLYLGEKTCFLNNVDHGLCDPFATARKVVISGFEHDTDPQATRLQDKRVLIYSYEDRKQLQKTGTSFLDSVFDANFERRREEFLGHSQCARDVLILRDPFNCLASRITMIRNRGAQGGMKNLQAIADNWKALARRAQQIRDGNANGEIVILFNTWISSREYRQRIAADLGGHYTETSMRSVSTFGGGSSFTPGQKKRDTAAGKQGSPSGLLSRQRLREWYHHALARIAPHRYQATMLTRRWRVLRGSTAFRQLFRDPEILSLSEELFGEIPGTRKFVKDVMSQSARRPP